MSFADLERGEGGIKRAPGQSPLRGNNNHGSNYGSNGHNGWNKGHDVFGDGNGLHLRHTKEVPLLFYSDNSLTNTALRATCFKIVTQADYDRKVKEISDQVFRISSNITSIQRLVGYVGTSKDTQEIRSKL